MKFEQVNAALKQQNLNVSTSRLVSRDGTKRIEIVYDVFIDRGGKEEQFTSMSFNGRNYDLFEREFRLLSVCFLR